ncbi:hypothetical protein PR048_006196 [Dryococelus australis]|uniref:Uncharacterized protein n=1 Tax=Dryococelus australis TaxID=614101 RepID=A0ABQ9IAD4_9NEOP|nr:hypothetical protein PR048_006196 [Dryococelus australis]
MPLVDGFSRDLPFLFPLQSGTAPFSPHFTLIGSQDLIKSSLNLLTQLSTIGGVEVEQIFGGHCLDTVAKVRQGVRWILASSHCLFQLVPGIFNGIHVCKHCRPFHPIALGLPEEVANKMSVVQAHIFILQNKPDADMLPVWLNNRSNDSIPVLYTSHIALNKWCSTSIHNAGPKHYGSASLLDLWDGGHNSHLALPRSFQTLLQRLSGV